MNELRADIQRRKRRNHAIINIKTLQSHLSIFEISITQADAYPMYIATLSKNHKLHRLYSFSNSSTLTGTTLSFKCISTLPVRSIGSFILKLTMDMECLFRPLSESALYSFKYFGCRMHSTAIWNNQYIFLDKVPVNVCLLHDHFSHHRMPINSHIWHSDHHPNVMVSFILRNNLSYAIINHLVC